MEMNEGSALCEQNVLLYDRRRIEMTGIDDVESFNEGEIILRYPGGSISLEGENLKVELFSADTHRLTVSGLISCLEYFGSASKENKEKAKSRWRGK